MAVRTALSSYQMYWYPWDDSMEEAWCRPMPRHDFVVNMQNNPITTYKYRMHQEDLARQFGRWYRKSHGGKKTVCLLGIRTDESLQRYSSILNKKYGYNGECWISRQFKDVCRRRLYTTGQTATFGMPITCSAMITISFTTFTIWRD